MQSPTIKEFEALIQLTPDWPEKGVVFRDISPLLAQRFTDVTDAMCALFSEDELASIDGFAGIDARGFIFASAMAAKKGKNLVIVRKSGKLPPPSLSQSYDLEYGQATLDLKPGAGRVILLDDVLATGGTLRAAADLCEKAGYNVVGMATLIDLKFLNDFEWHGMRCRSLLRYD